MTISLPRAPDGDQYEDFVAACLRALGYFTETHLILRDQRKEVLELDIVATPVGGGEVDRVLFEAKRDGMNFPNVFKLYGQRMYLGISSASLVSSETVEAAQLPTYRNRAQSMGISICHLPLVVDVSTLAPIRNDLTEEERNNVVVAAWYQHIAKRTALASFNAIAKTRPIPNVVGATKEYLFGVNAGFFQQTPLARAEALYSAWQVSPKLAGEAVSAVALELSRPESDIWKRVNDYEDYLWIQMIMHLETTARIRIIKNALDDFLTRGAAPPPTTTHSLGNLSVDVNLHSLPPSFSNGLKRLRDHPHATRLPYLFQVFSELLGGFLVFNDAEELSFVERLTGVPASEVRGALELMDSFFAANGSSMLYEQKNEILCLKMTPGYIRGGGSFLRRQLFQLSDYSPRYELGWLLGRWHNALYYVLEPKLGVSPP